MTKLVRIENADTSPGELVVEVWELQGPDLQYKCVEEHVIRNPTELLSLHIWHTRYLVIKEKV